MLSFSVYLGLFVAELTALACDVFLDIQYGDISNQLIFWMIMLGGSLLVAWRQKGKVKAPGKTCQLGLLVFGFLLFFFVFMRIWDTSRASLYMLGMLQASYNCVVVAKRQLNLSLLISFVFVIYATSHYRADWTMLFYLIPYLAAVVYTLVTEQIHSRMEYVRLGSLSGAVDPGLWGAISSASLAILLIGVCLYSITPQITLQFGDWLYGQESPYYQGNGPELSTGSGNAAGKRDNGGNGGGQWLTPQEMRAAANRPNMPKWQAAMIGKAADIGEAAQQLLAPAVVNAMDWLQAVSEILKIYYLPFLFLLLILIILMLAMGFGAFLYELPWVIWLCMQWDYLWLGLFANHESGHRGAMQYYRAMTRVFAFHEVALVKTENSREYLQQIHRWHKPVYPQASELTVLFENSRYGGQTPAQDHLLRMRRLYTTIFRRIE